MQISVSISTFDMIKKVSLVSSNNCPVSWPGSALIISIDILQDRAAKFVDQLSAIGGTMGLLTGFSLISAVEIIYFAIKIVLGLVRGKSYRKSFSI